MSLESQSTTLYDEDGAALSAAPGSAAPASALYIAGDDGANLQGLRTDTSGRQIAVGAAAEGAAAVGSPVLIAGWDGTDVYGLKTDTAGRQLAVGAAAAGAAVAGAPVLVGVSDGANAQNLKGDSAGRLEMVGAAADGAAAVGAPVQIGGKDGSGDIQAILTDTAGRVQTSSVPATTATSTVTSVPSNVANVTLLAANANRRGAIIVNQGNRVLFAKMGATATTSSFTARIPARGYWEVPFGYTGIIDGIWNVANGSAVITELEE